MRYTVDPSKHSQDPQDVFWRNEILQVFLAFRGHGYAFAVSANELQNFLTADEAFLTGQLERLTAEGYLKVLPATPNPRYALTNFGELEAERRFGKE
jgi:hypothetical protein